MPNAVDVPVAFASLQNVDNQFRVDAAGIHSQQLHHPAYDWLADLDHHSYLHSPIISLRFISRFEWLMSFFYLLKIYSFVSRFASGFFYSIKIIHTHTERFFLLMPTFWYNSLYAIFIVFFSFFIDNSFIYTLATQTKTLQYHFKFCCIQRNLKIINAISKCCVSITNNYLFNVPKRIWSVFWDWHRIEWEREMVKYRGNIARCLANLAGYIWEGRVGEWESERGAVRRGIAKAERGRGLYCRIHDNRNSKECKTIQIDKRSVLRFIGYS